MGGITAAQSAAIQWASGELGVNLLGLVWVPDQPGKLPKPLKHEIQIVSGGVPRIWEMPYIQQWRFAPKAEWLGKPANHFTQEINQIWKETS